ncbi:MAG TPA: PucR family transcriptional regulator ligand-binding domain-containing protein, partial [Chloroflexota bacterium]|nr:PucR family transcriptional regulator ligand-binding domain-containing protein [Chloroflexota bacterium]
MITIEQIWSLALPVGTTLVAGLSGLQKSVSWPIVLRARAPGFGVLRGGEFAIMNVEMLRQLDERLTLTRTIERLAVAGVVGIAVLGEIEASAFAAADDKGTPLFQLPANTSRTELEANIRRLIADQHTSFAQHSENVMAQLHALALNGQGTIQIIGRAVELLGRPVALTDRSLTLREFVGMPGSSLRASDAAAMLSASSTVVLEWARTTALSPASPPTGYFGLAPPDITHLVAPIVSQGTVEGWLSAIGHGLEPRETDRQTIAHAAAACAIGFVRDRSIRLAESSATGLLVADLILAESDRPSASIVARAERTLGLDSAASYAVIVIDAIDPDRRHLVEAEIGHLGGRGLWKDNGQFLGFFPTSDEARKASCQAFILAVARANGDSVRAGVGPIARGL